MKPDLCYLICTTQRSGTHLLNEALRNTGLAGTPGEWFEWDNETERNPIMDLGQSHPDEFLQYLYEKGTGPNGVFGCNIMWSGRNHNLLTKYINILEGFPVCENRKGIEALRKIFPNLHFIYLIRKNKLQQAVSHSKVLQTKVFHQWKGKKADNFKEPKYDYYSIRTMLEHAINGDKSWAKFFNENEIKPFRIVYEDLAESFEETALGVLDFLGIDYPADLSFAQRILIKQANHINDEWVQRFLAQSSKENTNS